MSAPRPDSVTIHRLRIRHPPTLAGAGLSAAGARLRQQIEWSDWPEAPGESWVFIRSVQARAPAARLARELTQATRAKVLGGGNDVVRFANLTELLAALVTDLVLGAAPGRWYWRRWSHLFRQELARALTSLLGDHGEHLAAVCARLAQGNMLGRTWLSLDEAGAHQLAAELAWRGGFSLPTAARMTTAQSTAAQDSTRVPVSIGSALQHRWAPVLAQLPRADARLQLALLLIGQECAPLMLQRAPEVLLAHLARALLPLPDPTPTVPVDTRTESPGGRGTAPSPEVRPVSADKPAPRPAEAGTHIDTAPDSAPVFSPATAAESAPMQPSVAAESGPAVSGHQHDNLMMDTIGDRRQPLPANQSAVAAPDPLHPALQPQETASDPGFDHFHTRQGGLLYLLNVLNRSEIQTLMGDFWDRLPNGWGWLYRLGQTLQLDESDPIVPFIATQLGFESPAELAQLPSLPAHDTLLALARRWYGRAGLWQPQLLQLDARIRATPSHVDLFASLGAVQLPVRLAGLDINPGWLPWLGRVVSFHYD